MTTLQCQNCGLKLKQHLPICPNCDFPISGDKSQQIRYKAKLLQMRDLLEEAEKSVKAIYSMSLIFFFMAFIVLIFSLIFGENHYLIVLIFSLIGVMYFLLNRQAQHAAFTFLWITLVFYILHTAFELLNGIYPKSPVKLDEKFLESKGASIVYYMIPIAYALFRLAFIAAFVKYILVHFKLRKNPKMLAFLQSKASS